MLRHTSGMQVTNIEQTFSFWGLSFGFRATQYMTGQSSWGERTSCLGGVVRKVRQRRHARGRARLHHFRFVIRTASLLKCPREKAILPSREKSKLIMRSEAKCVSCFAGPPAIG